VRQPARGAGRGSLAGVSLQHKSEHSKHPIWHFITSYNNERLLKKVAMGLEKTKNEAKFARKRAHELNSNVE
jgi:hypothetical protein